MIRAKLLMIISFLLVLQQEVEFGMSQAQHISSIFVFGDSIVDAGNNNYLSSSARSNFWPYGCDFTRGPTGRFCNGKTIVDLLGERVGIADIPVFADPSTVGQRILAGVNYASAGAGILDDTGRHLGDRISLSQQVINFEKTLDQLRSMMPGTSMSQYLAKSIAFMSFGTNDYIHNYLLPSLYPSRSSYNPSQFANLLLNHYARQILALYNVGLRKFFLLGLWPLGCIPSQRGSGQAPPGRCVDSVNQILGPFNEGLRSLVQQLNTNHPSAIFVYANAYHIVGDILNTPAIYGFRVIDTACCPVGEVTCLPSAMPCPNRNEYAFWDAYNPTEATNNIIAQRAFSGPQSDSFPINFYQLSLV